MKVRIQKQMALGEVYDVECRDLDEAQRASAFLDERLWTLNRRVMDLNATLGKLPPEQMATIGNILAGLAGIQIRGFGPEAAEDGTARIEAGVRG